MINRRIECNFIRSRKLRRSNYLIFDFNLSNRQSAKSEEVSFEEEEEIGTTGLLDSKISKTDAIIN